MSTVHSRKSAPGEGPGGGVAERSESKKFMVAGGNLTLFILALRREQQRPRCPTLPVADKVGHKRVQRSTRCERIVKHPSGTANGQRPSRAISLVTFLFKHKKVTLP